jgi:hypothetical protein
MEVSASKGPQRRVVQCRPLGRAMQVMGVMAMLAAPVASAGDASSGTALQALRWAEVNAQVDGRLEEPFWAQASRHQAFAQLRPQEAEAAPAAYRTAVQVVADHRALVVGIRAWDPHPERIRAPLSRRDRVLPEQDHITLYLDPVGLKRAAPFVRVGAGGSLADGVYDSESDLEDVAPDFEVEVASHRLPDGYSVEIRWPLSELRFAPGSGLPWRIQIERAVPREEIYLFSSVGARPSDLSRIERMAVLDGLGDVPEQAATQGSLSLRPQFTARRQSQTQSASPLPGPGTPVWGLDLKWRPRSDWVLDASWAPDDALVDLDAAVLSGNTRFSAYLPEKRSFFLESLDVLGTSGGQDEEEVPPTAALFHSRGVVAPRWGLRATWRGERSQALLMQLRDQAGGLSSRATPWETVEHEDPEAADVSLVRGRHLSRAWSLAAIATQRQRPSGRQTQVWGGEWAGEWTSGAEAGAESGSGQAQEPASLRWRAAWAASRSTAGFDDQGQPQPMAPQAGQWSWLQAKGQRQRWNAQASLQRISPEFTNDNGHLPQRGVQIAQAHLGRQIHSRPEAPLPGGIHLLEPSLAWAETTTLENPTQAQAAGERVQRSLSPGFWLTGPRNLDVWGGANWVQQRTRAGLALHTLRQGYLGGHLNPNAWFTRVEGTVTAGQMLDVAANRVGRGVQGQVDWLFRAPMEPRGWGGQAGTGPWWLEYNPQLSAQRVQTEGAGWGQTLQEWQLQHRAYVHFSPQAMLRLTWLQRRLSRSGQAQPVALPEGGMLQPQGERRSQWSVLAQARFSGGHVLSAGTTGQTRHSQQRVQEFFLKYSHLWGG